MALPLAILLFPAASAVVIIAPRHHYLLLLGVLLFVAVTVVLFGKTTVDEESPHHVAVTLICALGLLLVRPISMYGSPRARPNLETIQALRAIAMPERVGLLASEGNYAVHIGNRVQWVAPHEKNAPLGAFLVARSIGLVVVSDALCASAPVANDVAWHSFTNTPSEWGFVWLPTPQVRGRRVLVRSDLVAVDDAAGLGGVSAISNIVARRSCKVK